MALIRAMGLDAATLQEAREILHLKRGKCMLRISRVHIDYQKNPVGIAEMPQFGWEIVSDKRNVIQKAYTLQISKNPEFTEFVYDSGRVVSGNQHI